jgi:formylglycine-generating enzyme required for sulfatase activity
MKSPIGKQNVPNSSKTILLSAFLATLGVAALAATAPEALATASKANVDWASLMLAKRAALRGTVNVQESSWQMVGPLRAKSFSEALFPEKGVDIEALQGRRRVWQARSFPNGVVNQLRAGESTATYLFRTLVAKESGSLSIGLGSDDGIEFWFNGEKLLSKDVPRGAAPDQDVVKVTLRPGTNTVLLKIFNRTGDCGFFYNTGSSIAGAMSALSEQFPVETKWFTRYIGADRWFRNPDSTSVEQTALGNLLKRLPGAQAEREQLDALVQAKMSPDRPEWLHLFLGLAAQMDRVERAQADVGSINLAALRLAVEDLTKNNPGRYLKGPDYLKAIAAFEKDLAALQKGLEQGDAAALKSYEQFRQLEREALLANPALDFDQILLVKRREGNLGLPQNWQGNTSLDPHIANEIATLRYKENNPKPQTLYRPATNYFVGDVDLNFDADKMLFSSIGTYNRWQVFEIKTDGTGLRQVTLGEEPDVDNYDPIYLPDGRIIYDSTANFQGVPCVGGADYVGNLHLMNADGTRSRRICFDQDNDWCPVMLPSGRVLYLRWEYTDSAHYFARNLMSMNPDGTGQTEYYHSDSYWPNSTFFARPLPGSSTKFVGIISGHHGVPRMGEMILFDISKGRQEDTGAYQHIPGYGKPVKGIIKDQLVQDAWPKFLHPYPLNEKYFLVAAKPTPSALWGLYLVDIFDNMVLLKEEPGYALFEPLPLRKTVRPSVIPDRVKLADKEATVYIHNIYAGEGLKNVPHGAVKQLRIFQYEYSYRNQGGHYFVGLEGPWDLRRMIGTVPVLEDGSAMFKIPANTPVSVQPLDREGKALQLMRSWFVGMPGEVVSCVGCHERQNTSSTLLSASAARQVPVEPTTWYGPKRGFSYIREIQPVLDKYCVECHNGQPNRPNLSDPTIIRTSGGINQMPKSYTELHPYIRRNGPEGDYHTLTPLEFHADTSLLIQMLKKGHYNVKLDPEAMDRLLTWIDINVPAHGTYHEASPIPSNYEKRRYEMKKKYADLDEDIEAIPNPERKLVSFVKPAPLPPRPEPATMPGWPIASDQVSQMQSALGSIEQKLDLGNNLFLTLKKIPAGAFVMGDVQGDGNEFPMARVKIEKPFWMGTTEISLQQYQQFDPTHHNGYYDMHYKDQVKPGYLMDFPQLPVIRISWNQAMAFCQWLSTRTGKKVVLPTEAQWEWACRSGTASPMFYGDLNSDFSPYANLSDATISKLAVSGVDPQPIPNPDKFWDFVPKEKRFNDGVLHLAEVGHYKPNPWGLHDMIGNVAEWTLDDYRDYPYQSATVSASTSLETRKVVRGGSWSERPKESRASSRVDYPAWQAVYNVGFRVVVVD